MAGQGCINEGSDTRQLGWLICPLQRLLSFKSTKTPKLFKFGWDTYLSDKGDYVYPTLGIVIWPFYIVRQKMLADNEKEINSWKLFRFGWRYDVNWSGYIFPTAANKIIDKPMEKGY